MLDQRIVWEQTNFQGTTEDFIRLLINDSIINPRVTDRKIKNFKLSERVGFTSLIEQQVTFASVGERVRELCLERGWGYRVRLTDSFEFEFKLFSGVDLTESVIFSPELDNLVGSQYVDDSTNLANVAVVAGEGEGVERARTVRGAGVGLDRHELYIDARDISRNVSFEELTNTWPMGSVITVGSIIVYRVPTLSILVVDNEHLTWLEANFPSGTLSNAGSDRLYSIDNVPIASLETVFPEADGVAKMHDVIYISFLLTRASERLSEFGNVIAFEGSIQPETTFVYNQDFSLGDIVTIENEYRIRLGARIVEIVEVYDGNGISIEPRFEYVALTREVNQ